MLVNKVLKEKLDLNVTLKKLGYTTQKDGSLGFGKRILLNNYLVLDHVSAQDVWRYLHRLAILETLELDGAESTLVENDHYNLLFCIDIMEDDDFFTWQKLLNTECEELQATRDWLVDELNQTELWIETFK